MWDEAAVAPGALDAGPALDPHQRAAALVHLAVRGVDTAALGAFPAVADLANRLPELRGVAGHRGSP